MWSGETIPWDSQITVYLRCQHSAIFSTFASLSDSINRTEIQLKGWLWRYIYIHILYIYNLNGDFVAKVLCVCLLGCGRRNNVFPQRGSRPQDAGRNDLGVSHCDAKTLEEMTKREWEGSAFSLRMGVVNSENWGWDKTDGNRINIGGPSKTLGFHDLSCEEAVSW